MDVTKVLASVPILKTVVGGPNAQKNASPSGTVNKDNSVQDSVDISSASLSAETLTADQASEVASEVGTYFAENDEAIGADANKLAQL